MNSSKLKILKRLEYVGYQVKELCSKEENEKYSEIKEENLPEDIFLIKQGKYEKYISEEDIKLFLQARQEKHLETINYCSIYFVVISVISLIIWFTTIIIK